MEELVKWRLKEKTGEPRESQKAHMARGGIKIVTTSTRVKRFTTESRVLTNVLLLVVRNAVL